MKLLLDENLSDRIPARISPLFTGSSHVKVLGLANEPDETIWQFARDNGYAILTKDCDFHQMSLLRRFPPKIIFLRIGNCSTEAIMGLLTKCAPDLSEFLADPTASILILEK
jgi:predicted nuclease of predicted toxin-antitoxin system